MRAPEVLSSPADLSPTGTPPSTAGEPVLGILFVGPQREGSTTVQRRRALEGLGHRVVPVDTFPERVRKEAASLPYRLRLKAFRSGLDRLGPKDLAGAGEAILRSLEAEPFHVLWIDKGLSIGAEVLARARSRFPSLKIVGFSPDDMANRDNQSPQFLAGLRHYHLFLTTKSYNVAELAAMGCPRVEFVGNSYAPEVHRPLPVTPQFRESHGAPVGFVGQWERDRGEQLARLAEAGIPVKVWGYTWERARRRPEGLLLMNRPVWGDEYARTICATDVNLCFLRKANRDLQTTRSVEIPACGGFLLAERTDEHRALFEEGREAEFFGSVEELIGKARHYLARPEERMRIAEAGRARCLSSGYSYAARLGPVLARLAGAAA